MPESTLSLTFQELEAFVGEFLGFGNGANFGDTAWPTRSQAKITKAVKAGIRMFYYPAPLPGDAASYDWSFIRQTRNLAFATGDTFVQLPDDFGGLEGPIHLVDSNRILCSIEQTNEQRLDGFYSNFPDRTGGPEFCAIRQNSTTSQANGQRAQLYIYPAADVDYTVQIFYYILPDALSTTFPYALGGATHAETIKTACLAAAELDQNYEKGVRYEQFIERMRASVSLDRRYKPQTFGYNADTGYNRGNRYGRWPGEVQVPITWDGVP